MALTVLPGTVGTADRSFGLALCGPVNARLATTVATATVGVGAPARVVTLHGQRLHPTSTVSVSGKGGVVASTQYVDQTTMRVTPGADANRGLLPRWRPGRPSAW